MIDSSYGLSSLQVPRPVFCSGVHFGVRGCTLGSLARSSPSVRPQSSIRRHNIEELLILKTTKIYPGCFGTPAAQLIFSAAGPLRRLHREGGRRYLNQSLFLKELILWYQVPLQPNFTPGQKLVAYRLLQKNCRGHISTKRLYRRQCTGPPA